MVLYRPLYVCVKTRRHLLKEAHSKDGSKDSTHPKDSKDAKDSYLKESHSKYSSINSSKDIATVNKEEVVVESATQSDKRRKQKRQSLKNQHSLDLSFETDRQPEPTKRGSLVYQGQMSLNKDRVRLSSLDEQAIELEHRNLVESIENLTVSAVNQSSTNMVISTQPKGSSYHQ